jgi:hypothetical protein
MTVEISQAKENENGKDNEAVVESPKVMIGSCGTDVEVSPEEQVDLEKQLEEARTKLRHHERVYVSAKTRVKQSDSAEKLLLIHIAIANVQEALEKVHDLEKRMGTCTTRKADLYIIAVFSNHVTFGHSSLWQGFFP